MATEGRVAKPEWRWGCHSGTPNIPQRNHTRQEINFY